MNAYEVVEVDRWAAAQFWASSTRASVFTHPEVSQALSRECRWLVLEYKSEPVLMWPVSEESFGTAGFPYSYFYGPFWADSMHRRGESTQHRLRVDGIYAVMSHLSRLTSTISFELAPDYRDLRPFTWWNEGVGLSSSSLVVEPRYTASISGLTGTSDRELLRTFRKTRRQEVIRIERDSQFYWTSDVRWQEALDLYVELMERSGVAVNPKNYAIRGLKALSESKWGYLVGAREESSGVLASFSLVLHAKDTSNLVLTGVASQFRRVGLGAWQTFQSIRTARAGGAGVFDFNGANSPRLGDDKHSYGAREQLYFRLTINF